MTKRKRKRDAHQRGVRVVEQRVYTASRFKEAARWHDANTVKARELARVILATWIGDRNLCDDIEDIAEDFDFGDVPHDRREMVKERAADILRDFSNEEAA